MIRPTYIFRDPRDALLSALDYGKKATDQGSTNAFSHLSNFDIAINFMREYLNYWAEWIKIPNILLTRYEDLISNYDIESSPYCNI